jgi:hypothetical protein
MAAKEHKKRKDAVAVASPIPSQVVLYEAADGKVTVKVLFARETFWLTQKTMADLFGVNVPAVNKHLKNIYASGELTPEATVSKMETVQDEGGRHVSRAVGGGVKAPAEAGTPAGGFRLQAEGNGARVGVPPSGGQTETRICVEARRTG